MKFRGPQALNDTLEDTEESAPESPANPLAPGIESCPGVLFVTALQPEKIVMRHSCLDD